MSDKKVSKVEYAGETLIDLTADTVSPEVLKSGYTAHTASGEQIVGTNQDVDPSSLGNIYRKYSYGKTDGLKTFGSSVMKVFVISVKDYSKLPVYSGVGVGSVGLVYKSLFGSRIHLLISFMTQDNQIIGFPEFGLTIFDDWFGELENYVWKGVYDSNKITIVCAAGNGNFDSVAYFDLLYIDADPEVYEITNVCELIDSDSSISGSSETFINLGKEFFTKPFTGATASENGYKGWVPAPAKAAVNGDYTLLPTGDWGMLKSLGYYTATTNTNPDSPTNKIRSYLIKSNIAASLSAKLPSTNGQNLFSIPSADGNEYAQVSFDTTTNSIYFRTRKKVNEVDTWTDWQAVGVKEHNLMYVESFDEATGTLNTKSI